MSKIDFTHHQAAHCENGVTSNIFKYNGIDISEPMVFGMGSGLFFIYIPFLKVNEAPAISFRPMPGIIFSRVAKQLGIQYKSMHFRNIDQSFDALDRNLDQGIATGLQVGVYHLPYFPDEYRFHFNAHNIVVYGKEGNEYLVSDPVMEHPTRLTRKELEKVRFAKGVFAPKGHMYYPVGTFNREDMNFEKSIRKGLKRTIARMTAPVPVVGINGINYLAKKIPYWAKKEGTKKINHYLAQFIRMQEEIGTGGGGFRYIFGAFLQEASEIMDIPRLKELSHDMTIIGDDWRDFALHSSRICKNRNAENVAYSDLSEMLRAIAAKEKNIYMELKTLI